MGKDKHLYVCLLWKEFNGYYLIIAQSLSFFIVTAIGFSAMFLHTVRMQSDTIHINAPDNGNGHDLG